MKWCLFYTERLEHILSSKTINILSSNRKLTGRKRIAFDSNVHQIAIFSDELENVKQGVYFIFILHLYITADIPSFFTTKIASQISKRHLSAWNI
jgi:hypothetical protein